MKRDIVIALIATLACCSIAAAVDYLSPAIRRDQLSDSDLLMVYRDMSGGRTVTGKTVRNAARGRDLALNNVSANRITAQQGIMVPAGAVGQSVLLRAGAGFYGQGIMQSPRTIASATTPCARGEHTWDRDYEYRCYSTNNWGRWTRATW
jgi:hypothetical protein